MTTASLDRWSVADARALVDRFYPAEETRNTGKGSFGGAIRLTDDIQSGSWSVTMREDYIALDAGRLLVFGFIPDKVSVVVDIQGVPGTASKSSLCGG
jgi:hypothetical protein